ncbi:HEAT repeat domain-containing protein [Lujinxingia vulgaris]|uniref:HEAT repeat domain-containing protein n=1 Tax=Lujinxingia vulgaris TaxID=2600176 RepID=A0A5C6X5A8_9DELT|nr:HEAT repeat domain-containing protein [Lujinxingia vulgaris]TXD36328.1 HEAT repeat domain-containing protein [Lujinxingia vulgaris]
MIRRLSPSPLLLAMALALAACQDSQTRPDQATASAPVSEEPGQGATGKEEPRNLHAELRALFGGYEYVPTREDLMQVGPAEEVVPVLLELYRSEKVSPHQQHHALRALQFYPEHPQVARTYEEVIRGEESSDQERRVAVRAYGRAFGDQGLELLGFALAHPDYHTRASAIAALELTGSERSLELLQARLNEEPETELQAEIKRILDDAGKSEATR